MKKRNNSTILSSIGTYMALFGMFYFMFMGILGLVMSKEEVLRPILSIVLSIFLIITSVKVNHRDA